MTARTPISEEGQISQQHVHTMSGCGQDPSHYTLHRFQLRLASTPSNTAYSLLENHRRHRVIDADYPAILPESDGTVRGSLVEGMTEGDCWRLDIFEGDQYTRQKVKVKVLKDKGMLDAAEEGKQQSSDEDEIEEEAECESYVWTNPASELDPSEWDFEEFKRDKMKAWMGDGSYLPEDETVYTDEDRARANGEIVVDSGFADVDHAVAAQKGWEEEAQRQDGEKEAVKDGTGGRGVNGRIGKELAKAQQAQGQGKKVEDWNVGAY